MSIKGSWNGVHGRSAYQKKHCICDICKKATRDYESIVNKKRNQDPKRKEQMKEYLKKYKPNNIGKIKEHSWRRQGIDPNFKWEDYTEMFIKQEGKCLSCSKDILLNGTDKNQTAHVDHNHSTGKVRGLLCVECNWLGGRIEALGIEATLKLIKVIEEYK